MTVAIKPMLVKPLKKELSAYSCYMTETTQTIVDFCARAIGGFTTLALNQAGANPAVAVICGVMAHGAVNVVAKAVDNAVSNSNQNNNDKNNNGNNGK